MAKSMCVMAVGDIFLGGPGDYPRIHNVIPMPAKDDLYGWMENIAPILQEGDFTFGNLEGPICVGGEADISKTGTGGAVFKMPPHAAEALKRGGFDGVALANNHLMDLGADGLLQTITNLDRVGIAWAGGGHDSHEAHRPAVLEKNGVKVAFLSYTSTFIPGTSPAGRGKPGMATVTINTAYEVPGSIRYAPGVPPRILTRAEPSDVETMREDVRAAKAVADIVVVSWHWGLTRYANAFGMGIRITEAPFHVVNYQEDMGRAAIDAGADLVMGHHPHRLQGLEMYKGALICYSLCNIAISFGEGPNFGEETVVVKGHIDPVKKRITKFTAIPVMLPNATMEPYRVPIRNAQPHVDLLTDLSNKYNTRFRIEGEEIAIED